MRRLLLLAALAAAPAAVHAQTAPSPAPAVSADSLAARAVRAETFFFAGKSADLRALSDSAFAAALTDEGHQQILAQVALMGGALPAGDWSTFDVPGMAGYRRPYTLSGQPAAFLVVFAPDGRIAGLALRPGEG